MFEINIPDDFMNELLNTNVDDVCKEALNESAPMVEETMKQTINANIRHHDMSTGELVRSIKADKAKKKKGAWVIKVMPRGNSSHYYYNRQNVIPRRYACSNAFKLIMMEYGNSRQSPSPVLDKIYRECNDKVLDKLQETYNRMVGV